jgi:hypothetical protein
MEWEMKSANANVQSNADQMGDLFSYLDLYDTPYKWIEELVKDLQEYQLKGQKVPAENQKNISSDQ